MEILSCLACWGTFPLEFELAVPFFALSLEPLLLSNCSDLAPFLALSCAILEQVKRHQTWRIIHWLDIRLRVADSGTIQRSSRMDFVLQAASMRHYFQLMLFLSRPPVKTLTRLNSLSRPGNTRLK